MRDKTMIDSSRLKRANHPETAGFFNRFPSAAKRLARRVPFARQAVISLKTLGRRPGGAPGGVLFLFYHDVAARDRDRFASQLRALRGYGAFIGLGEAIDLLGRGQVAERRICLTFDDGYQGAFDNAAPILQAQNIPATFFIVPGWIDAGRPGVIGWQECRALAEAGIEIGSHTVTHRHLADLPADEVMQELQSSKARIEAELGRPCLHCACPYGQPGADYQPGREPALARAAGYRSFLTTIPRRAQPGMDPWALPRVRMEPGWGAMELRYALSR